jgi:hypothetical protein
MAITQADAASHASKAVDFLHGLQPQPVGRPVQAAIAARRIHPTRGFLFASQSLPRRHRRFTHLLLRRTSANGKPLLTLLVQNGSGTSQGGRHDAQKPKEATHEARTGGEGKRSGEA